MPEFNKTGPEGKGALTGRRTGRCIPETDSAELQQKKRLGRFRFGEQSESREDRPELRRWRKRWW